MMIVTDGGYCDDDSDIGWLVKKLNRREFPRNYKSISTMLLNFQYLADSCESSPRIC